jgi:acyl-CoA synthetase (NDP forming)
MTQDHSLNLDELFYPKSLAVVGASPKRGYLRRWGGNTFIEGAINLGFPGNIYPVHPKAETILGLKAYKTIREIPGDIDLVIFSIPHTAVLPVMEDCAAKKVKFVHLFTAGFSETGRPELIELENKLLAMAREAGIRIVGPNCMGLYCPEGGLAWTSEFPRTPGPIGFVSQSGQLAGHFVQEGADQGLRFSKVVSFGNAADLKAHDFLDYLADDEKTRIIGAYIEGLKDGRAFFETARKITRKKTPGRLERGTDRGRSQGHPVPYRFFGRIRPGLGRSLPPNRNHLGSFPGRIDRHHFRPSVASLAHPA